MFKDYSNILAASNGYNSIYTAFHNMTVREFLNIMPDISIRLRNALIQYPDLLITDITHHLHRGIGISLMEELEGHLKRLDRN